MNKNWSYRLKTKELLQNNFCFNFCYFQEEDKLLNYRLEQKQITSITYKKILEVKQQLC